MYSVRLFGRQLLLAVAPDGSLRLPLGPEVAHLPTRGLTFSLGCGRAEGAALESFLSDDSEQTANSRLSADAKGRLSVTAPCAFGARAMRLVDLREACSMIPDEQYAWAVKAAELLHYDAETARCGICGGVMERASEISKRCRDCGVEVFPHVSPCVIVLVTRGEQALLVHSAAFTRPFYGLVAGFVETGESLEQCVHREIMEETSLRVRSLRYFGSQPWPYPHQLMVGFTAEYDSGTLAFADGELTDGGFYSRDNLPPIPSPPSLARTLIDAWLRGEKG